MARIDGKYVCNPSLDDLDRSDINLFLTGRKVVPGTDGKDFDVNLVMLEGDAREIPEDDIVEAIDFGLESMRPMIELQDRMRETVGKTKRQVPEIVIEEALIAKVTDLALEGIKKAYLTPRKLERYAQLDDLRQKTMKVCTENEPESASKTAHIFEQLERKVLRSMIMVDKKRSDGRSNTEIRPISSEVGLLPRVHGSALFNRGETQALVTLTLGTAGDEQRLDFRCR